MHNFVVKVTWIYKNDKLHGNTHTQKKHVKTGKIQLSLSTQVSIVPMWFSWFWLCTMVMHRPHHHYQAGWGHRGTLYCYCESSYIKISCTFKRIRESLMNWYGKMTSKMGGSVGKGTVQCIQYAIFCVKTEVQNLYSFSHRTWRDNGRKLKNLRTGVSSGDRKKEPGQWGTKTEKGDVCIFWVLNHTIVLVKKINRKQKNDSKIKAETSM